MNAVAGPSRPPTVSNGLAGEWRYEMRREAQLIVPGLYLGPFQASLNASRMQELGITHVLCVRDRKETSLIYPRHPDKFQYMTLEISDSMDQNIITVFPSCLSFIEGAINGGGTVLVHCSGGITLSPALVVGYLMWKYDWNYEQALQFVQQRRYCISPLSFQVQLKEYEPIYLAQKMLQAVPPRSASLSKRQMDDDDDSHPRRPARIMMPPMAIEQDVTMS